jgi:hypothetical protein
MESQRRILRNVNSASFLYASSERRGIKLAAPNRIGFWELPEIVQSPFRSIYVQMLSALVFPSRCKSQCKTSAGSC